MFEQATSNPSRGKSSFVRCARWLLATLNVSERPDPEFFVQKGRTDPHAPSLCVEAALMSSCCLEVPESLAWLDILDEIRGPMC